MIESTNTYFAQSNHCYVIIENVPCLKCEQCGEIYYRASVLEKIDEILDGVKKLTDRVAIMDFRNAA